MMLDQVPSLSHKARIDGLVDADALRAAESEFRVAAQYARSRLLEVTHGRPTTLGLAREIMGNELFLGSEEVGAMYGVEFPPDDLLNTTVPFRVHQLEAAQKSGDSFLTLRVPGMTMPEIEGLIQPHWNVDGRGKGRVFYTTPEEHWYVGGEDFFNKDVTSSGWVLAAKKVLPSSLGLNALDQMEVLANHVREIVFGGQEEISSIWAQALTEFESAKGMIGTIIISEPWNWKEVARRISALKLFTLSGRRPVDALSDAMVWRDRRGDMMLNVYERTPRLSSSEHLVVMGDYDSDGAGVQRFSPTGGSYDYLGVSFSPQSLL